MNRLDPAVLTSSCQVRDKKLPLLLLLRRLLLQLPLLFKFLFWIWVFLTNICFYDMGLANNLGF